MTIDFRVLYGRATTRPPIEKGQIEIPSERDEQEHRQQPEHKRFELRRHLVGNIAGPNAVKDLQVLLAFPILSTDRSHSLIGIADGQAYANWNLLQGR